MFAFTRRRQVISISVYISDAIGVGYFFLIAAGVVAAAAAWATACPTPFCSTLCPWSLRGPKMRRSATLPT